ncbi:MAG: Ger(x)C family spore germination protein [Clostridiaceae bacterium]|nr:Ger(x)C family spore germination protein [Clostridiaceae bacterium]
MKKALKKCIIFLNICFLIFITSGCWNNHDITDVSIAVAAGLDKTEDDTIELTLQLVKPAVVRARKYGGFEESAVSVFSSTGDMVFQAVRNILSSVNKKVYFGHLQLIVIGEELAREGISDILDFFERDHEINPKAYVIIAKGTTARKVLHANSKLETIPAIHITSLLENDIALPKINKKMLFDLLRETSHKGHDITIGVIEIEEKDGADKELLVGDMKVTGTAVFKKDKLVGWLDPAETRGYLLVADKVKSGIINIPDPLTEEGRKIAIEIIRSRGKRDVLIQDGHIILSIEIEAIGNIGEQQSVKDIITIEKGKMLAEQLNDAIKKNVKEVIEISQKKFKSDIYGFGQIVHIKYPDYWKQIKDNWDYEFSNATVDIQVTSTIKRPGLITQPTRPQ